MATLNIIGKIQDVLGDVRIVAVDEMVRDAVNDGLVYEDERIVSSDPDALFQIKYSELSEATVYAGVFDVHVDSSVTAIADGSENIVNLPDTMGTKETVTEVAEEDIDIFETEAGEDGVESNSQNIEDNPEAIDYLQDFTRGTTDAVGFGSSTFEDENLDLVNRGPEAVDDLIDVFEDTPFTSSIDLDANDIDLDGNVLSVLGGTFITTQGGTLVLASDGSYTYTAPETNFNGIDTVNYTVTDGFLTDVGTLTVNVIPVNDIATVSADAKAVTEDDAALLTTGGTVIVTDVDNGEAFAIP
ncbi:MAG: hypothetical protein ACI9TV_002984, partial [Sulfurimonas sp.]|uniref:cadherin-like domain-containing protein n=1 Tax=Sulfurimonas sp. TaxID=2022749 RepID=UPI0039E3395C